MANPALLACHLLALHQLVKMVNPCLHHILVYIMHLMLLTSLTLVETRICITWAKDGLGIQAVPCILRLANLCHCQQANSEQHQQLQYQSDSSPHSSDLVYDHRYRRTNVTFSLLKKDNSKTPTCTYVFVT